MKIKLDDRFTLNSDRYCFWISEARVKQKGKDIGGVDEKSFDGYHPTIETCFESFFTAQSRLAESKSISNLIETMKNERKRIKGWCEILDKEFRDMKAKGF